MRKFISLFAIFSALTLRAGSIDNGQFAIPALTSNTPIPASNLFGTMPLVCIPAVTFSNIGGTILASQYTNNIPFADLTGTPAFQTGSAALTNLASGNGSALTQINSNGFDTGTLSLLNTALAKASTSDNRVMVWTNGANVFAGNGAGLTSVTVTAANVGTGYPYANVTGTPSLANYVQFGQYAITQTNLFFLAAVDGGSFSNATGRNLHCVCPVSMTPAALLGSAIYSCECTAGTNKYTNSASFPCLLGIVIPASPGQITFDLFTNGVVIFTNRSTQGSAKLLSGSTASVF